MIHEEKWLLLDPKDGYPFGVLAGPSLAGRNELHGPFKTEDQAMTYAGKLMRKYEDYEYANIVKIEVPHVRTVTRENYLVQ